MRAATHFCCYDNTPQISFLLLPGCPSLIDLIWNFLAAFSRLFQIEHLLFQIVGSNISKMAEIAYSYSEVDNPLPRKRERLEAEEEDGQTYEQRVEEFKNLTPRERK